MNDTIEVQGSILLGFLAASDSLNLLLRNSKAAAHSYDVQAWYPLHDFHRIMEQLKTYTCPDRMLLRIGMEMMSLWYHQGPGHQLVADGVDFLRFQTGSNGVRSVFRGPPALIGQFDLTALDEAAGTARIHSTSPFDKILERGVLLGGLGVGAGLLYYDVEHDADNANFEIRFVTAANLHTVRWHGGPPQSASAWRLRHLQAMHRIENDFWVAIHQTLHTAMETLTSTREQLVLREKMASIGALTAGIAHEVNNPTNFAHVGAQGLGSDLERFREFLLGLAGPDAAAAVLESINERIDGLNAQVSTILEGTSRVRDLVKDLRTFSRLDEADRKAVAVADSVRATVNLVRTQFAHVTEIECALAANPTLECWPAQLNQVFMNLIVNACHAIEQHRPGGGGHLHIRSRIVEARLLIEFEDNGCGMDAQTQRRIFDPFFTTKTVGRGTGLGLSISSGIIHRHGGDITVRSAPGAGACFTVAMPLHGHDWPVAPALAGVAG
jgi:signal transduction histidine kinase